MRRITQQKTKVILIRETWNLWLKMPIRLPRLQPCQVDVGHYGRLPMFCSVQCFTQLGFCYSFDRVFCNQVIAAESKFYWRCNFIFPFKFERHISVFLLCSHLTTTLHFWHQICVFCTHQTRIWQQMSIL